ncbi:hypothetical protein FRC01_006892 [Tulasnella sp. 417]|nr:hypothetical protein FRC01_006892 [Tulasnella sp. 417]
MISPTPLLHNRARPTALLSTPPPPPSPLQFSRPPSRLYIPSPSSICQTPDKTVPRRLLRSSFSTPQSSSGLLPSNPTFLKDQARVLDNGATAPTRYPTQGKPTNNQTPHWGTYLKQTFPQDTYLNLTALPIRQTRLSRPDRLYPFRAPSNALAIHGGPRPFPPLTRPAALKVQRVLSQGRQPQRTGISIKEAVTFDAK